MFEPTSTVAGFDIIGLPTSIVSFLYRFRGILLLAGIIFRLQLVVVALASLRALPPSACYRIWWFE